MKSIKKLAVIAAAGAGLYFLLSTGLIWIILVGTALGSYLLAGFVFSLFAEDNIPDWVSGNMLVRGGFYVFVIMFWFPIVIVMLSKGNKKWESR